MHQACLSAAESAKPVDPNLNPVDPNPEVMHLNGSRSLVIDRGGPFSHCTVRMRARIVL